MEQVTEIKLAPMPVVSLNLVPTGYAETGGHPGYTQLVTHTTTHAHELEPITHRHMFCRFPTHGKWDIVLAGFYMAGIYSP